MDRQNRRKNYFINKKFQGKFILKFCGLVILSSFISGIVLYLFSRGTLTTTFIPGLIASSLVAIILISVATAIVVIYLSHHIAGPLFNIERSVQKIGKGDLSLRVNLRSTDELIKLADCFNEMTENLKAHISEIKAKASDLGSEIDGLGRQDELKGVRQKKKDLDKAIGYFTLQQAVGSRR
ncbi:MAG: HAMP domain-containing protein [Candidatus Omnitrophota bacterium]|nr:HAMP domain-containing protein [Candidatus Omnitrophota bacterium]